MEGKDEFLPEQYELVPYGILPRSRRDVHVYPFDRPWNKKEHVVEGRRKCWCCPSRVKQQPHIILHVDRED